MSREAKIVCWALTALCVVLSVTVLRVAGPLVNMLNVVADWTQAVDAGAERAMAVLDSLNAVWQEEYPDFPR